MTRLLDRLQLVCAIAAAIAAVALLVFFFIAPNQMRSVAFAGATCFFTSLILSFRKKGRSS